MKHTFCLVFFLLLAVCSNAAEIDMLMVKSTKMNKEVQVVVITPSNASNKSQTPCPVIYLLHGFRGNATTWLSTKPELPQIADEINVIFVCPDGNGSWYWDSPLKTSFRYESFIAFELVEWVDKTYKTIARREGRAISGMSMGGHGAMWLAIRHKDIFGAVGSTSGGVDIRPFPLNWKISELLGEMASNKSIWDKHTVILQVDNIQDGDLAIIIDCGKDDFFLEVNTRLHHQLSERGIKHDFIIRPGAHKRIYWHNSIDYHILFFSKFFRNCF